MKKNKINIGKHDRLLRINWDSVKHNINYFRNKLKAKTKLMLVIKADAYGNNALRFAELIQKQQLADYLCVAYPEEGVELRTNGISLPIMVLNPAMQSWEIMVKHCLEPEIHHLQALKAFNTFLKNKKASTGSYPVHLKLNTGMNRLGFDQAELPDLIAFLRKKTHLEIKSILSHLSCAGITYEDEFTMMQIKQFKIMCKEIEPHLEKTALKHILNTDGIERHTKFQFDMVRLGIGIHGASKLAILQNSLQPTTQLISKISAIRKVEIGAGIGYSKAGIAQKQSYIATLPIGYADGFSRWLGKGNWQVEINGELFPTIGDICMDLSMVDLGEKDFPIDTEVIIFGGKKSLFDFAAAQYTITYEALTNIGKRVKREIEY